MLNVNCACIFFLLLSAVVTTSYAGDETAVWQTVAAEISYEASLPVGSPVGHPLPLAAHWNTGWLAGGFSPEYQLEMIAGGHYLLPSFYLPAPWILKENLPHRYKYYEKSIKKVAELNLPVTFICTQWERYLTEVPKYYYRTGEDNPNVINRAGDILKKVSPFGPKNPWYEAGEKWTSTPLLQRLQEWYPNPPSVRFVSNNEHKKLLWHEVQESSRYLSKYGSNGDDVFQRQVVADGWIEQYRALQDGMRDGLIESRWKRNSSFIGYSAFGPRAFGRWPGWINYSLHTPGRISPWPLAWDGASLAYYVSNWSSRTTDYTVMSPQIEAMNWVFMLAEARQLNPGFQLELSTWDGYEPAKEDDKRKYYRSMGQNFTPERYEGYLQFGMWLLRPAVVREFRGNNSVFSEDEPYFLSAVKAVDRVHNHPILKKFWRKGRLVANENHQHPYQTAIPPEYKNAARWFLLDTDFDSKRPWTLETDIPVFSLALVLGEKPTREWLVYAHSPLREIHAVTVTLPGTTTIKLDVTPGGNFYHVVEKNGSEAVFQLDV